MNKCPHCECPTFEFDTIDYFEYGSGDDATMLYAPVTVTECLTCDMKWTDWRGEDARQAAVDKHLALLVRRAESTVDLHINHESMKFSINSRELQTLAEWQTEHNTPSCHVESYSFSTTSGIGTGVTVLCSCGESKNITDYGSW